MKRKIILFTICSIFFQAFFISCKKDKTSAAPTKAQLITAKSWYFSAASIDQNNDGVGDTSIPPSVLLACYTDNFLTFSANGTGVSDEGALKCNTSNPQTTNFTWSFTNAEQNVNFTATIFPGATGDFKIITLNDTQLILSKLTTLPGFSSPSTVIITFIP
jgi:hypothetical protein